MRRFQRYVGKRLLHRGGVGRLTPRINYEGGSEYPWGSILMSDFHYISHPVSESGGRSGYNLEVDWKLSAFDDGVVPDITLSRMIRLLKNNSSLLSQSLLNFRQFVTYGYNLEGSPRAKANVERILMMLERRRKPLSLLLGQLADGIYCGGGAYTEIVLAQDGMETIDFVVNDPLTVKFQLLDDDQYGEVFHLIKLERNGRITSLEGDPTIQYLPVNGDVNSPFGKPFLLAAIFPAVWQLMLLKDVRDVLRTQIYPFVHVKVDLEKVLESSDGDILQAEANAKKSRDSAIDAWQRKGNKTAIATGDEVDYNIISGLNRPHLGMLDPIVEMLSKQVSSGASMMPLFLGHNDSTSESNADVQWLIQIAIVRSVQRELNNLMTYNFNMMNQAAGIGGEVMFELITMNAMERLREANVFQAEEEALIKLIDHLSAARAANTLTDEEMIQTYVERRERIYLEAA